MTHEFVQHVSAVGALGEALDGTPAKRKRRAKRVNPNSEVTTNVVCYCLARFSDLVDFSVHVRSECSELVRVSELRDRAGRPLVAACGTASGYQRHWRRGEPTCERCRAAVRPKPENRERAREYARAWRARKKAEQNAA